MESTEPFRSTRHLLFGLEPWLCPGSRGNAMLFTAQAAATQLQLQVHT